MDILKKCNTCDVEKPLDKFNFHQKRADKRRHDCKDCWNKRQSDRRAGLSRAEETRKRRDKYGDVIRAQKRQYRKDHPEQHKNYELMKRYGITLEEKNKMFESQKGLCAICKKPGKLVVDHDHQTGKVRGLLHHNCNRALGFLQDSPEIAASAAGYLATKGVF